MVHLRFGRGLRADAAGGELAGQARMSKQRKRLEELKGEGEGVI